MAYRQPQSAQTNEDRLAGWLTLISIGRSPGLAKHRSNPCVDAIWRRRGTGLPGISVPVSRHTA
jgi:hypothetical protein